MSAKSKYAADLAHMKKEWKRSEKEYDATFGGEQVPEAVYFMKPQSLKLAKTKAKKLYVNREFLIVKGEHNGTPVRDRLFLHTEKGFVFLRQFIMMMGHKCPTNPEKVEDILIEIQEEAKTCKGSVSHTDSPTGTFTNIRINQLVEEGDEMEEYDLEEMSEKKLKKVIDKEELDIDPDDFDDEDDLREAVEKALKKKAKDGKGKKKEVDPDDMDEDTIREYISDNEIGIEDDLGFEDKKEYKKADEEDLQKALKKYLKKKSKNDDNDDDNDDDDDDDSDKGKKGKGKKDKVLEAAREFCDAWSIKFKDGDDVKKLKKKIATDGDDDAEYPEDELDEEEKELLEKLGLEGLIKKSKKKKGKKKDEDDD